MTFLEELAKTVPSRFLFTASYLASPAVLYSCHVDMHPRVTTGRAGSGVGKGRSSAGQPGGALQRRTAGNSRAWKLNKQKGTEVRMHQT